MSDSTEDCFVRTKPVPIGELKEGMIVGDDVKLPSGGILLTADTEIEEKHIPVLKAAGVEKVFIALPKQEEEEDQEPPEQAGPAPEPEPPAEKEAEAKAVRVLIVDDSKLMRLKLRKILQELRLEVVGEAENGLEGIKLIKRHQPDLVTMDIEMPVMNGIETTKSVLKKFPDMKIIVVSSLGQEKFVVECIKSGAKDFVSKPFDTARVKKAVTRVISALA